MGGTKKKWAKEEEELLTRHQQLLKDVAEADIILAKKRDMTDEFQ